MDEDDRVGGSPRFQLRHFSTEEILQINQLKELEEETLKILDAMAKIKGGNTRCLSLARTNVEQGIMWALKEIGVLG